MDFRSEHTCGNFDLSASGENGPRLRINLFNTDGFPTDNGATLDLLSIRGNMTLMLRPPETIHSVWGKCETDLADYTCYYTVTVWMGRLWGDLQEGELRLTHCKLCRKRGGTHVNPTNFYAASGPLSGNKPLAPAGSFGNGEYPPLSEDYKNKNDIITDNLVTDPVMLDADLITSGLESGPESQDKVNRECPLFDHHWRGVVEPIDNVRRYLQVCTALFLRIQFFWLLTSRVSLFAITANTIWQREPPKKRR